MEGDLQPCVRCAQLVAAFGRAGGGLPQLVLPALVASFVCRRPRRRPSRRAAARVLRVSVGCAGADGVERYGA